MKQYRSDAGKAFDHVLATRAVEFGNKYSVASNRLRAIMKNVITNKGVFRP